MLKRIHEFQFYHDCLITVQDNTMLKHCVGCTVCIVCLITVQDNTMLKLVK